MSASIRPLFDPGITAEPVVIRYLADCPRHIPLLAQWLFDCWGRTSGMHSEQDQIAAISRRLYRNRIPLAFIALAGSRPVGTASLKIQDMAAHKYFYHWLVNVFVVPEYRRRGIGTALVARCEAQAAESGVSNLFLHTPDREGFYRKLNWTPVERAIYYDQQVVIMEKQLVRPTLRSMVYYPDAKREYPVSDFPRF